MSARVPGKRLFDVVVAAVLLVVSSPVLAVSAWLVRGSSPGPAVHQAVRIGLDGQPFTMYKLRSMYITNGATGSPTTGHNDPRVTPIGRQLRRFKLDELPQLVNVLRGDMSLVGPRPEVSECVDLYTPEERRILTVRPGVTDLASIRFVDLAGVVGESENPHQVYMDTVFQEKNRLRLEYVDRQSWRLDLEILVQTLASVLGGDRGIRRR